MSRRVDVITATIAVAVHAGLAFAIVHDPSRVHPRPRPIEVEFRKPPPEATVAPATPRAPPPPTAPMRPSRPPHRKVALASEPRPTPAAPAPQVDPRPAPKAAPVFGIAMDSPTAAASPVAVPVGRSTTADPASRARPGKHGPANGEDSEGTGTGAPVSELEIKTMPEIDTDACGKTIVYPADAEQSGTQGDVRLRVTLDEHGRVRAAHVLSGLGHGLDQAAVEALTHRCRFTPAIAKDGRAVPFVVESYTFHFELPH